jgi:hypothetical protein
MCLYQPNEIVWKLKTIGKEKVSLKGGLALTQFLIVVFIIPKISV